MYVLIWMLFTLISAFLLHVQKDVIDGVSLEPIVLNKIYHIYICKIIYCKLSSKGYNLTAKKVCPLMGMSKLLTVVVVYISYRKGS